MTFDDLDIEKLPTSELKARLVNYQNRGASFIVGFLVSLPIMGIAAFIHPALGIFGFFSSTVLGVISAVAVIWIFAAKKELKHREIEGKHGH